MMTVIPHFNMGRVVLDYTQGLYLPAAAQYRRLADNGFTGARTLAEFRQRVRAVWPRVSLKLLSDSARDLPRGTAAPARRRGTQRPEPRRCAGRIRRAASAAEVRPRPPPLSSFLAIGPGLWRALLTPDG